MTRDIPKDKWREELDRFSREHKGQVVSVDVTGRGGQPERTEARELPLVGVSLDAPQTDRIAVLVGDKADDHVTHEVSGAVRIRMDGEGAGGETLRIEANDGTTTVVALKR
jgi:hypothetical protein